MVSVSQSTDGSGLLSAFVAIAVAFIAYYAYQLVASGRPTVPLPPGPRPLPLVGNLLGFPSFHPWETFSKWGETYGGIIHVSVLGQSIIVLNDARYAIDMLDRKGALYSDRPTLVMCGELIGWDEGPALSQFGDRWAEYRRFFSQFMGTKAKVEAFSHTLHEETNAFLKHLLAEPRKWVEHTQRFAGGFVLQLTYGYRASDPGGKELVKLVDDAMEGFSEATVQNAFLVDVIPVLRYVPEWFPGAAWKRKARMYHDYLQKMLRAPFELVKQQMAAGVARPSFTQSHLEGQSLAAEQERIIQWTAAGIYSGGADTTVAGIESFFLGITRHTDQQRRAQAELDAVLGFDCLPTLADRERLPYCEALYLEIMRCYTFGPLGLPHVVREDDVHDGYFIPKGSIIIPNNWKFFNNPKTYPQPKTFAPERFMGKEKQYDPRKYLFGYGRRTCPGIHLADASMWLLCMSVLALFDVEPPVEDGTPVVPPARFLDGAIRCVLWQLVWCTLYSIIAFVPVLPSNSTDFPDSLSCSHPEAFKCVIKPRSAGAEALVRGLSGNL